GERKLVIDSQFDGRKFEELGDSLGLFCRYLPINMRFGSSSRVEHVIKAVDESAREARGWQENFEKQMPSRNSSLPIAYKYEEVGGVISSGELEIEYDEHYSCIDRYKLKLVVLKRGREQRVEVHYDEREYKRGEVERIGEHYERMLRSVVEGGGGIGELEVM